MLHVQMSHVQMSNAGKCVEPEASLDSKPYLLLTSWFLSHSVLLCRSCTMESLPQFLKMVKLDNVRDLYSYWSHVMVDSTAIVM